jgi:hypothetical protein
MKNLGIITMRGWLVLLLVGFSMLLAAQPMQAVPGVATTPVQQGNLPVGPAALGDGLAQIIRPAQCGGIGVAFDGTDILYTCADENAVRKTDLASADKGMVSTVTSAGAPLSVDAIAWDPSENKLWGGNLDGGTCNIWKIDMSSGIGTFVFSFTDPSPLFDRCGVSYLDGVTVDTVTNTLYVSGDVSEYIRHLNKDGTPAAGDNIPFTALTAGLCPWAGGFGFPGCLNSGLTIGLDGNLFTGTASDDKIMRLDPNVPSLLGQFSTVTGRDEDLECGPQFTKPDGTVVETILSAGASTKIDVLEAPKGTCVSPTVVKGSISGMKFNDLNNNGGNEAEPGLPGWTITLTNESGGVVTNVTNTNGNYSFTGLADGNYTVGEVLQVGWTQTAPSTGTYTVEIKGGNEVTDKDFGNMRLPPEAACIETVNPAGKHIPTAGDNPKSGQNPDGFYMLTAMDMLDPSPMVFVKDTGSGMVFGPFTNGTKIKYTEANGATPVNKTIGGPNSAVDWHIKGTGDAAVYAVNNAGIKSAEVLCKVPPPPK